MLTVARRGVFIALTGISVFTMAGLSFGDEELFSRAVARFRGKDYKGSFSMARKAPESPQRAFLAGVSALRMGEYGEAFPLLEEAERGLPLLGDYALLYQAEALLRLKRYGEAATKAASIAKVYPSSLLIRRADRLYVEAFIQAGDLKTASKVCQTFIERYPSGSDSVEVLFQSARCREETDDRGGAAQIYRGIWLNNPGAPQAVQAQERLRELAKNGVTVAPYTPDELLRRASALYAQNEFALALQTLQSIPPEGQPAAVAARVDLRAGLARYRLRNYTTAEKSLARAATGSQPAIRAEARLWRARVLERQNLSDQAFALYMELVAEGRKQKFADDALFEAAGLRRGLGNYAEAAALFEQLVKAFPDSGFIARAAWESAWCRYLAGEYPVAAESFKALLRDEGVREKALYWAARSLENAGNTAASDYYRVLLDEYPSGFYAVWHREQKGLRENREPIAQRSAVIEASLPPGCDKSRLLAWLGMREEARNEMAALRRKTKGNFPGLARLAMELGDYGSAITLFLQNRPVKWEKTTLPLWTAGYPLVYDGLVTQHAALNDLPESLVYALIRAESRFSPAVKSPAGAIGLMQLMPATAKATVQEKGAFDPARLTVPEFNIKLGTRHFRDLLKGHGGDVIYSIAAYNAGSGAVERWRKNLKGLRKDEFIESIPYQETREYVKQVYASASVYRQLYGLR